MRPALREYFTFNNREKRGILFLSAVIGVLIAAMNTVHLWVPHATYQHDQFEEELASLAAVKEAKQKEAEERKQQYAQKRSWYSKPKAEADKPKPPAERFTFNPNNLPIADWMRLGLSEKQAMSIHKYESAGGSFRKAADVAKMYTISDELFAELEPWIDIPAPAPKPASTYAKVPKPQAIQPRQPYKKWEPPTMELNSATAEDLEKLRGIGPVLSQRIVKYRDARGGFQSIDQLTDVYGVKPEVLEENRKYLTIKPAPIFKLNINDCTAEQLQQHCHIQWKVVNAIIAYRDMHGPYTQLDQLQNCKLVDAEIFSKIAPLLEL